MRRALVLVLVVLTACATASGPRTTAPAPQVPPENSVSYPLPTAPWPLRSSTVSRQAPALVHSWPKPSFQKPALVVSAVTKPLSELPLPEVRILPLKLTPVSRSWPSVSQEKTPVPLAEPAAPVLPMPKAAAMTAAAAKAKPKAPATVPAVGQPGTKPVATPPGTAAATASLLPQAPPTQGQDFRWQDVNAVAGDAVTLHFDRSNWLYMDSPSQQKAVGFQAISRDKDATTFQFKPTTPGQYVLEFQRQDLVNQTTDSRKVRLMVVAPGTRTSTTGTAVAPQTTSGPQGDPLEASRQLAAAGKTSEAIQRLLQSYKADDTRMNLELARLLDQTGQGEQALGYLERNLTVPGPDFQGTLDLGTKLAAQAPEKRLPTYAHLWLTGTKPPAEDLYLQVFQGLRTLKGSTLAQEWSRKYPLWYPAPQFRDGYLFQLGQLLEAPGEGRNIQAAWKAYDEIVQNFPLSPYWKSAGERAASLNRHFLH